jgi:hypothetical protein
MIALSGILDVLVRQPVPVSCAGLTVLATWARPVKVRAKVAA